MRRVAINNFFTRLWLLRHRKCVTNASQRAGIFAIKQTIVRHQDSLERTDSKLCCVRTDYFKMFFDGVATQWFKRWRTRRHTRRRKFDSSDNYTDNFLKAKKRTADVTWSFQVLDLIRKNQLNSSAEAWAAKMTVWKEKRNIIEKQGTIIYRRPYLKALDKH